MWLAVHSQLRMHRSLVCVVGFRTLVCLRCAGHRAQLRAVCLYGWFHERCRGSAALGYCTGGVE